MNHADVPIWEKYTLTIEEAAKYFRIGENKLRKLAEENSNTNWVILNGNRIQIKRKQFEKMIDTVDTIQWRSSLDDGIIDIAYQGSFRLGKEHKMSEKRRDSKNRVLWSGESHRKDGRYAYKYTDTFGKSQFVYAWKLVSTDKTPKGKREDKSLREKVREIQKDLDDGIDPVGKKMTVCQLYEKHIRNHANVRHSTKQARKHLMRILEGDMIGTYRIENVKMSDAKEWALRMKEKGYSFITISNYKRSLKAAFYTAIQDDCIRKNSFDFPINTVIKDDTEPKIPLSPVQEESLLSFVKSDKVYYRYYDELIILLGTWLRISEFCGLTISDIDFENRTINVDYQLQYSGKKSYRIETPKTDNGIRKIPMSDRVLEALQRVMQNRKNSDFTVDGYTGFLFLTRNGTPQNSMNYDIMFRRLVEKYNKNHEEALPAVTTPHTLRHTFCTNMADAGMNPKESESLTVSSGARQHHHAPELLCTRYL